MAATTEGKRIGNIGILDIRTATEASIAEISRIGNVGSVIYSPETAHFLPRLNLGNVGSTIEISGEVSMRMGPEVFSQGSFKHQAEPLSLLVMGPLTVYPDVPEADIAQGLANLMVLGPILCPAHLAGAIESKLRQHAGPFQIYHYQTLINGDLTLDENYLQMMADNSELSITGKLQAPQILPNDLLAQKLAKVEVFRRVTCREENAPTLLARLDKRSGAAKVVTIPAGFELVEQPLELDAALLEVLPSRKLYCLDQVRIAADVEASLLDQSLETLICTDLLICPAALKATLGRKCNLLTTKAIFYSGELWLNETDLSFSAARFDFLTGKATLINFGDIMIGPDVEPKILADRLDKVHNFGDIMGTSQQIAALQARLGINEGDLEALSESEGEDTSGGIGNIGHLKL